MRIKKKNILLLIILLLILAAIAFLQFTQFGYLMTVPYRSAFAEIADRVYINRNYSGDRQSILAMIDQAEERVGAFFGELRLPDETVFIICDDKKLTRRLGQDHAIVSFSLPSEKHFICISDEYLELDVLAHEITHAQLRALLSSRALKKIPVWFDEGLALQNDHRERYSEEQWMAQTDNGRTIVALEDMDAPSEFYAGDADDRRFRYLNAKHELDVWMAAHGQQGLLELIGKLNDGADFNAVYNQ